MGGQERNQFLSKMDMLPFWAIILAVLVSMISIFAVVCVLLWVCCSEENASASIVTERDAAALPTSGRSDGVWSTGRGHDVEAAQTVQ